MAMTNLDTVRQAIELARAAGADEAEAYLARSRVLTVEVGSGQVETIKQAEDLGLSVRALVAGRMGLSYATDFDAASLRRAAHRAVEVARASDRDACAGFAEPETAAPAADGFDPEMDRHSADEKIERAFAVERAAKEYDARIVLTRRVSYRERVVTEALANTRGIAVEQCNNLCGGSAMVLARQGAEQQVGGGMDTKRRYAEFDACAIGRDAAERAVTMLGATDVATQRASIVLEPRMAAAFLGIIANLVRADQVLKGKSLFAGKLGQAVAGAGITLIDDGAYVGAPGARAFDDEGVPSRRTVVVADGVLQNYLHTTHTARQARAASTSNAARASFKASPDVAASNFALQAGTVAPADLRANVTRGLWVRNLMNLHTANPISGEFSFGANGMWIENGKLTRPVRGVTISGNLTDLLLNVRGIGNDLEWQGAMGLSIGAPSLLIEQVSIAGK